MERDVFLAQVRAAIGHGKASPSEQVDPGPLVPDLPSAELVALFSERLAQVDGSVHTGDPSRILAEIVELHGSGPFLSWDAGRLPVPEAIGHLQRLGCTRVDEIVSGDAGIRREQQTGYMDVHIGLTGAEAAFAESGSIVLRSGSGRPRMASLVPLVHIALLPSERIFRTPMHWLVGSEADIATEANVVYITGPSRTADIEQQLTLGVHGPKNLHVILV